MSQPQILIIEDEPALAQSLQVSLLRDGFEVVLKSTGQDGISYVQKIIPHLVLLDIRLPDGSGPAQSARWGNGWGASRCPQHLRTVGQSSW